MHTVSNRKKFFSISPLSFLHHFCFRLSRCVFLARVIDVIYRQIYNMADPFNLVKLIYPCPIYSLSYHFLFWLQANDSLDILLLYLNHVKLWFWVRANKKLSLLWISGKVVCWDLVDFKTFLEICIDFLNMTIYNPYFVLIYPFHRFLVL